MTEAKFIHLLKKFAMSEYWDNHLYEEMIEACDWAYLKIKELEGFSNE